MDLFIVASCSHKYLLKFSLNKSQRHQIQIPGHLSRLPGFYFTVWRGFYLCLKVQLEFSWQHQSPRARSEKTLFPGANAGGVDFSRTSSSGVPGWGAPVPWPSLWVLGVISWLVLNNCNCFWNVQVPCRALGPTSTVVTDRTSSFPTCSHGKLSSAVAALGAKGAAIQLRDLQSGVSGNLLKIWVFESLTRSAESETLWGWVSAVCVLTNSSRDSDALQNWEPLL